MRWISFSLVQSQRGKLGFGLSYHWHSKLCRECPHVFRNTKRGKCLFRVGYGASAGQHSGSVPPIPQGQARSSVRGRSAAVTCRGARGGEEQAPRPVLLCGDKLHNHADNPRTSRARTQVHAWVFNFILEELVKFTAKFLYQFSYLQWKLQY